MKAPQGFSKSKLGGCKTTGAQPHMFSAEAWPEKNPRELSHYPQGQFEQLRDLLGEFFSSMPENFAQYLVYIIPILRPIRPHTANKGSVRLVCTAPRTVREFSLPLEERPGP